MRDEFVETELHDLARKVASCLGWEWSYSHEKSYQHAAHLDGPEGMGLYIVRESYPKDRLTVGGEWPTIVRRDGVREVYDPRERLRIGFSWGRPANEIARGIVTRFLPQYVPEFQNQLRRKQAAEASLAMRDNLLDRLSSILGVGRRPDIRDYYESVHVTSPVYGTLQVSYDASDVHIDVRSVPVDVAVEIAKLLASVAKA